MDRRRLDYRAEIARPVSLTCVYPALIAGADWLLLLWLMYQVPTSTLNGPNEVLQASKKAQLLSLSFVLVCLAISRHKGNRINTSVSNTSLLHDLVGAYQTRQVHVQQQRRRRGGGSHNAQRVPTGVHKRRQQACCLSTQAVPRDPSTLLARVGYAPADVCQRAHQTRRYVCPLSPFRTRPGQHCHPCRLPSHPPPAPTRDQVCRCSSCECYIQRVLVW